MSEAPGIVCIGSVLWDVVGRAPSAMRLGSDVPGRISRHPGGVALNIAMALRRFGMHPVLLSAIGRDAEGEELAAACARMGIRTDLVYRSDDLPTDRYMAVEGANGLIAAIADAHSLEAAGAKILAPLADGRLADPDAPYSGLIALDGNLTAALLSDIASDRLFARADLRVAPASPGKAERLMPFVETGRATLYVNLEEAVTLSGGRRRADAAEAASALVAAGARRVLVTDGGREAADADAASVVTADPPPVLVTRVTGAGDTFMAAHIAAEAGGQPRDAALGTALRAAADYVSAEIDA